MNKVEFGAYLKNIRQSKKMSLRQVEIKSGISNSYVYYLEKGERNKPSPEILAKLAHAYNISYEDLMDKAGYIKNEKEEETDELLILLKHLPENERKAIVTIWEDGYSFDDLRKALLTLLKLRE